MADYDYLPAGNGSGDAALMHVAAPGRLIGATVIPVDSVVNVPTKFIATVGTALPTGFIDPATKIDFKGHLSGSTLVIDAFEPGSVDAANTVGQIVVIKPNTGWSNRVAAFIKNATNFGTPENLWAAALTAASATLSGALSAASAAISGALTVGANLTVAGQSRVNAVAITSAGTITPTSQVYDVTALAVSATVNVPSYTAANGISGILRIRDNGSAQGLTFASGWLNVSGLDTPTATIANKELSIGYMYNSANSKYEIQGINQQA